MQKTRKLILQHLKEHGEATVDELAGVLRLTSVTVRHHLDILRGEDLVAEPLVRRRTHPGRPQYTYTLTQKAAEHFPSNYCDLAAQVLAEVRATPPPQGINVFFADVGARLAASAPAAADEPLTRRLDRAAETLNSQGYEASWAPGDGGYILQTCNCPYHALVDRNPELCGMDLALVGSLLGAEPERLSRVVEGAPSCTYLVRTPETLEAQ